jgi:rod shape-determining protein MreB
MVIDIGGGTTEVAVIALGGMVVWESIRVGGYEMDEAIVDHVKNVHKLMIGQETAEAAKIEVGSAWPTEDTAETSVAGRDLITGLLRRVSISGADVRRALEPPVSRIVSAVKDTLERTPPELAADLGVRGIAGRRRLTPCGIDERLRSEVGLPVQLVESPLTCVAEGAGRSLDELETWTEPRRRSAEAAAALILDLNRAGAGQEPVDRPARGRGREEAASRSASCSSSDTAASATPRALQTLKRTCGSSVR